MKKLLSGTYILHKTDKKSKAIDKVKKIYFNFYKKIVKETPVISISGVCLFF